MGKYFTGLNYSLANEDNRIESALSTHSKNILAVCGSGARAFSLIHDNLENLTIVDISQAQLDYARFKQELIKVMSFDEYLTFMGLKDANLIDRISIFKKYQHIDWVYQYFQQIPMDMLASGFVYSGRWESFLIKLGALITTLTGYENFPMDFEDRAHAFRFWPEKRLKVLINILAHPVLLNKLLYKGQMISLNNYHLGEFLINNFKQCFFEKDPKFSFFHQMLFLGKIKFPEAYPLEFQRGTFEQIKNFKGRVSFVKTNLLDAIEQFKFDFASLSNVASYFDVKSKQQFEKALLKSLLVNSKQQIVLRSFLRPDPITLTELNPYLDQQQSLIAEQQDATLLYKFQILKKL